jgi:hypothetical protein
MPYLDPSDIFEAVIQGFLTVYVFFTGMMSASCPNPQPGGLEYLFYYGLLPLTHPAWEALLATYVTADMALRFI